MPLHADPVIRAPAPATSLGRDAGRGALAAGPALLVLLLGGSLAGPGVLELVSDGATRFVPLGAFDLLIGALGPLAKGLLAIGIGLGAVGLGAAGGVAAARGRRAAGSVSPPLVMAVGAVGAWAVASLVALPLFGVGLLGLDATASPLALHLPLVAASVVYGLGLAAEPAGAHAEGAEPGDGAPDGSPGDPARRRFLGRLLAAAGLVGLVGSAAVLVGRVAGAALPAAARRNPSRAVLVDAYGVTPAITPVADFYEVAKDLSPPVVDGVAWRLRVDGLVERPLALTLDEVRALPAVEGPRTLQCISNEVVEWGPYIGNQRWRGVRVRDVLERAGVANGAAFVNWSAADGYTESIPLEVALDEETWLAYEMGGAPLTTGHGFPLRVLIAGRYGMKQPKALTGIALAAEDGSGFWERRGWDPEAFVRTMSRIDLPRDGDLVAAGGPLDVYGIASSGDRGIARVEVSADGGSSWLEATLEPLGGALGPLTWVRWRARVVAPSSGGFVLAARATDGSGAVQTATEAPPLPSGATGWHRVRVWVG